LLSRYRQQSIDFKMRFELGLETPYLARVRQSALTIVLSYFAGSLILLAI